MAQAVPPPKILLVDDLPSNLLALEALLSGLGSTIVKAHSGAEALKELLANDFAVVILDVRMPDLDGFETARLIRDRGRSGQIPIVFVTALATDPDEVREGYSAGGVDYLFKPVDSEALLAKVRAFVEIDVRARLLQQQALEEQRAREETAARAAELERLVQERTAALEQAGRRKSEMLAMLAHELRNPLSAISSAVELLALLPRDTEKWRRAYSVVRRQLTNQGRVVDDLLDAARAAGGRIAVRPEVLDLCTVVRDVVEERERLCAAAVVTASCILPPDPVWVWADAVRLEQIVANLFDNALRYSDPHGCVAVSAAVSRDNRSVTVTVRDQGIGIRQEDLPHVWEPLFQADSSLERVRGGVGLGLTLVRELVALHGGSVEAHSDGPGKGATFSFTLPLPDPEQAQGGGSPSTASRSGGGALVRP